MAYLDVISLPEAKVYLRVDDTLTADDNSITRMINGALGYIERYTNVLVFDRTITYLMIDGAVSIYDGPINSVVSPTVANGLDVERKNNYNNYCFESETIDLKLNVGHENTSDIPQDLIDVAYEIIDLMYYEHETGKDFKKDISSLSREILDSHKRFIL